MKVKIDKSKNDQLRDGNEVLISEAKGPLSRLRFLKSICWEWILIRLQRAYI